MLPAPYRIQLRRPPIRCAEMHPSADLEAHVHTASQPHSQPDTACTPAPATGCSCTANTTFGAPWSVDHDPCSRGVKLFSAAPQTINVTESLSRALSLIFDFDKLTPSLFAQRAPRSLPRILLLPQPQTSSRALAKSFADQIKPQAHASSDTTTPQVHTPKSSAPDLPK